MGFLLALQFLTIIPIRIKAPLEEKDLARAMIFYPAVGLLIGGMAAAVHFLLSLVFNPPAADIIVIGFLVFVTGNLHLDGLIDAADGLLSEKPSQEILNIMRDSRVGSHGVSAGFLALLGKFVFLGQVSPPLKTVTLLLMPLTGRWSLVYAATVFPYLRKKQGTGFFVNQVGKSELILASIFTFSMLIIFLPPLQAIIVALVVLAGTAALGYCIFRKLGGMTGDTMGAMSECTEVLFLILALLL